MSSQDNKNNGNNKLPKNSQGVLIMVIAAILTLFSVSLLSNMMGSSGTEISYTEFLEMVDAGEVKSVKIEETNSRIVITPKTEEEMENEAEKSALARCIDGLSSREKLIMQLRFGLTGKPEQTQKEVADRIGISQSYISRLEKRIIQRLKGEMEKQF